MKSAGVRAGYWSLDQYQPEAGTDHLLVIGDEHTGGHSRGGWRRA
ncbi:hypothetical protein ACIRP2_38415 [Streptomyces sp. NPDC101194]